VEGTPLPTSPKSIKVLAIDGGGIRGIIPAMILAELQRRIGTDLWRAFDLIAGTSTGGIIALGIGTACNDGQPYSPSEMLSLYLENGATIFRKSLLTGLRELFGPKYSPAALEETLEEYFQAAEFRSALTPLLISSYDLAGQIPFFFKSHRIAAHPDYNWKVVQIARATSAAPTYFPPFQLQRDNQNYALADGGVYVNNPSMAAYAEALSLYRDAPSFVVVSAGTGDRQDHIQYSSARRWGLFGWATKIIPVFMDSVSEAVDYELKYLPQCSYYRLQVLNLTGSAAEMDNVSPENLAALQQAATQYISSSLGSAMLDEICAQLREGRGSDMPGIGLPKQPG
jgi:uncharacterized protein